MNTTDIRDTNFTQANFWMICGPFSAGIVMTALLIAFRAPVLNRLGFRGLVAGQELQRVDRAKKAYDELRRRVIDREAWATESIQQV